MQRRCREGCGRITAALPFSNADRSQFAVGRIEDRFLDGARRGFVFETELFDLLATIQNQARGERLFFFADVCLDSPVLAGLKRLNLQFTFDDHAQSGTLHAPGRQTTLHFLP